MNEVPNTGKQYADKLYALIDESVGKSEYPDIGFDYTYVGNAIDQWADYTDELLKRLSDLNAQLAEMQHSLHQSQLKLAGIRLVLNSPGV